MYLVSIPKLSSMKHTIFFLFCMVVAASSCSRHASAPDHTKQVYDQLHGKYKVVSSISSEAADVNLDGTATSNMLSELSELADCDLEVRIVDKDNFLLVQFWPQQFVGYGTAPVGYDPSVTVNYARQAVVRKFSVNTISHIIQVKADPDPKPDMLLFPFPVSVTTEGDDTIQVVISKKLYTSAGWKTVDITTLYHRYTMRT